MITARGQRLFAISLLALIAAAGSAASPGRPGAQEPAVKPRYNGTFRIKGYTTPFNPIFDPTAASHNFICEQLYDGLVKFDSRLNPMPALAQYWLVSDNGARITFHLRQGVRFHNGRELTAEDVKYSLERLVRNRPGNIYSQYFTNRVVGAEAFWRGEASEVTGFRVLDPWTFEIRWTRPFVSGLYLLGMYYCKVLPKSLLENQGRGFFQKPIGTGPFRFAEWIRSARLDILGVRLERNPFYFERRPYLSAIEYSPFFTNDQFEAGSVHLVPVTSERINRRDSLILENNTLKSFFLTLSCDIPPLDRPEVRRALALGLDKARLAEAFNTLSNAYTVLNNFIPPQLPGFFPRASGPFTDTTAAELLLDRFLPGGGRKDLTLTLLVPAPRTEAASRFARELERQLGVMGIRLEVRSLRKPEEIQEVRAPYLRFLEYSNDFPDPENIVVPLFHSRSAVNGLNSRYANAHLDGLLDRSVVEPSWERRTNLFKEAEKILFQDTPAIPLFSERVRIAVLPKVRGLKVPALGFIFLNARDIWLED